MPSSPQEAVRQQHAIEAARRAEEQSVRRKVRKARIIVGIFFLGVVLLFVAARAFLVY